MEVHLLIVPYGTAVVAPRGSAKTLGKRAQEFPLAYIPHDLRLRYPGNATATPPHVHVFHSTVYPDLPQRWYGASRVLLVV